MILHDIVDFCQEKLDVSDEAKQYLDSRELTKETIQLLRLGFCPINIHELLVKIDPKALVDIHFIKNASYCYFTNRIIFPVWDQYNNLVAIAGRILPRLFTGKKKYFNTFYTKGRTLYGLNLAIPYIRQSSEVLVTEGHLDFAIAFQHNVRNIVSTCGTAFTFEHAMLLSRYAEHIKVLFDADAAGMKAAQKILEKGYRGVTVDLVSLDKGEDVDSYIRKFGANKFLERVNETPDNLLKAKIHAINE